MTPCEIEVLIHCHVSPSRHPRANAPAIQEAIQHFVKNGLIEIVRREGYCDTYKTTKKGEAHIEQLCSMPWPKLGWVGYDGDVILYEDQTTAFLLGGIMDVHMYDFNGEFSQVYKRKCQCGKVVEISTQKDERPEYYTNVFVKCDCGKSVQFILPVN